MKPKIPKSSLHLPGPDFVDRVFVPSDRNIRVLCNLQRLFGHGRLGGTGYLSILPVDQTVEYAAGPLFVTNPAYLDPEKLAQLAVEGGCSALASTRGILGMVARRYAHKIPFLLKCNHNERLTMPAQPDQTPFALAREAREMGCVAVGATVFFGAPECRRQIEEVRELFAHAHEHGMATVLWCYTRNPAFQKDGKDYHAAVDLSSQAIHLGATLGADIVKQKLPNALRAFRDLTWEKGAYGGMDQAIQQVDETLLSDDPVDLCRYQVAHAYMGRVPLLSSGGPSGASDLADATQAATVNKMAGGAGLILGRKATQKSLKDGIAMLHAVQDVYLDPAIQVS